MKNLEGFCPSETVSGFGEDALVVALVGGDDVVGAERFSWGAGQIPLPQIWSSGQ